MSASSEVKHRELNKVEKIEVKMMFPYEFYINVGYTFSLFPIITFNEVEKAFDWLYFHIGIIHHGFKIKLEKNK